MEADCFHLPFFQHMGAQLGQQISKPLYTMDRCNPSLAVIFKYPPIHLVSLSGMQGSDRDLWKNSLQDADDC